MDLPAGLRLIRDPLRTLDERASMGQRPIAFRVAWQRVVVLDDPADIRATFVGQRSALAKGDTLDGLRLALGSGLITADGDEHLRQRRAIAPAFSAARTAGWATVVAEVAERHIDGWRDGETRAIDAELLALSLVIAGRVLFDHDLAPRSAEIGRAIHELADMSGLASMPFAGLAARSPLPIARRFRRARATLRDAVAPIVEDAGDAPAGSILEALRRLTADLPPVERRAAIRDHVLTLLVAGHVTSGNALAWASYLLATNRLAEDRLLAEVDAVVGDRPVRGADLDRLPYARAAFAEAMRLYPPAWAIGRRAVADVRLGATTVPPGTLVVASPWLAHRDPRQHPDPLTFEPRRFLDGDPLRESGEGYFPFGLGSRKCIGEPLAWMEGTLVLSAIARRWRLRPGGEPARPKPEITLSPAGGLPMRLTRRRPAAVATVPAAGP